jgi:translation initiation factor IF-2
MSDVERVFDRFIDAFAADLLEIARAYVDVEVERALAVAERSGKKESKVELKLERKAERLARKEQARAEKQRSREEKRAARLAEKEQLKQAREQEREERQQEHDRLKQERIALKQELEAERRRLREAGRKRPARQLPLDFDGLRTPAPRRREERNAPGSPPPLFVHKRKRDGQIEKLARPEDAVPAPAGGATATPPSPPAE